MAAAPSSAPPTPPLDPQKASDERIHQGARRRSSQLTSSRLAINLLRGWTITGSTCSKCHGVPLMRSPDGKAALLCVVCDVADDTTDRFHNSILPNFEDSHLFDLADLHTTNLPSFWQGQPNPTPPDNTTRWHSMPPPGKLAELTGTINLTNEPERPAATLPGPTERRKTTEEEEDDAFLLTGESLHSAPTHPKQQQQQQRTLPPTTAARFLHPTAPHGRGSTLMTPNTSASMTDCCLTASTKLEPHDERPMFIRQKAMPLSSLLASEAYDEASHILKRSLDPFSAASVATHPKRAAAVWNTNQSFDTVQLALSNVLEKLTHRVENLVSSESVEDTTKLISTLDAMSKALEVMDKMNHVRTSSSHHTFPRGRTSLLLPHNQSDPSALLFDTSQDFKGLLGGPTTTLPSSLG